MQMRIIPGSPSAAHWLLATFVLSISGALVAGCGSPPITPVDGGRDSGPRTDGAISDAGPRPDGGPIEDDGGSDGGVDIDGGDVDGGDGDGGIGGDDGGGEIPVPATYAFDSRFDPGTSSVSYSGQVARQVLIVDLAGFIETREDAIAADTYVARDPLTMEETVLEDLAYFFENTAAERAEDPHGITTTPPALQTTYGELSMTAFLREKLAGNDAVTDHRDWSTEFVGFSDATVFTGADVDVSTPTGLLTAIFTTVASNADDASEGVTRTGPGGEVLPVHVTARGIHLAELAEKMLLGALTFSQGADDYLDDEEGDPTKGLLSPNTRDGTNAYTVLEHAWDEGYGYFGAPRHASMIALADLIGTSRAFDGNADSMTDLRSEYIFPVARYTAQRDNASNAAARTTFFADAELAFRTGRTIIANAGETLTEEELDALRAQRDIVVASWERGIAATAVRYLNGVIRSTLAVGTPEYDFLGHAGQWSEMKGLALAFQFNRSSPMLAVVGTEERFVTLHELLGDAPVLSDATLAARTAYVADLIAARTLIGEAYGFDAANLGDATGMGGW